MRIGSGFHFTLSGFVSGLGWLLLASAKQDKIASRTRIEGSDSRGNLAALKIIRGQNLEKSLWLYGVASLTLTPLDFSAAPYPVRGVFANSMRLIAPSLKALLA
jgi:hypothetical protein